MVVTNRFYAYYRAVSWLLLTCLLLLRCYIRSMFDRGNLKQSSAKWRRVLNESPFRQQMKLITIPASWSLISNSLQIWYFNNGFSS